MSSKKLLVVEDDADVRLGYRVLLRAHDYQTCFAEDAALALSVARKELPDLIILDLGTSGRGRIRGAGAACQRCGTEIDPGHRRIRPRPSHQRRPRLEGRGPRLCAEAMGR